MTVHKLKIYPIYFEAIVCGAKTFEIRKNDRDYQSGDTLILQEYRDGYTGNECKVTVTCITNYAQQEGYVVMAIKLDGQELPAKQDKVVVPAFVAEFIASAKPSLFLGNIFRHAYYYDNDNDRVDNWLSHGSNHEIFARAWLDGYEIEKVYYVRDVITGQYLGCDAVSGDIFWLTEQNSGARVIWDEAKIKAVDSRLWAFAVPVEEETE